MEYSRIKKESDSHMITMDRLFVETILGKTDYIPIIDSLLENTEIKT